MFAYATRQIAGRTEWNMAEKRRDGSYRAEWSPDDNEW